MSPLRVASRSPPLSSRLLTQRLLSRPATTATPPPHRGACRTALLRGLCLGVTVGTAAAAAACSTALAEPLPEEDSEKRMTRWVEGWAVGRTAFHRPEPHHLLQQFQEIFLKPEGASAHRVLVPLCGKTVDIPYLAGHEGVAEVIGVEGVQQAVDQFIEENSSLQLVEEPVVKDARFKVFQSSKVSMVLGDFFELKDSELGGKLVDKVWDRAALVAVEPNLRTAYVDTLYRVLKPGGQILLVTFDRAAGSVEAMKRGPPFSIPESEVMKLFSSRFEVKLLDHQDVIREFQRFQDQGLTVLYEDVYLITKTS